MYPRRACRPPVTPRITSGEDRPQARSRLRGSARLPHLLRQADRAARLPEDALPYLWSYIDGPTGRRFMGCVQKVFKGEIDIAGFEEAERTGGFGGIKMTGRPLPHCQTRVEPAFEGDGPAHTCTNPSFFDARRPAEIGPAPRACGSRS